MQNTCTLIWYQVATTIRAPLTRICTLSTPVLFSAECLFFLPRGGYLSSHSRIMSTISHSIIPDSGWQTHSQPSSMSGCTYSMCSAFYLPTDRPLTCENLFLHRTGFSENCHYTTSEKMLHQQNILINCLVTSVRTSDSNDVSKHQLETWPDHNNRIKSELV